MFSWLHAYQPSSILRSFGPVNIYWYGLIISTAILICSLLALKLSNRQHLKKELLWELFFYLIIFGLIGNRLFDVFLYDWNYFSRHLVEIPQIWTGGLAIHGSIFVGLIVLWIFARRRQISFWVLGDLVAPVAALGQAIGRWGNYFNQEIFGLPTSLPWGIPIDWIYRPAGYENFVYFHPLFLYESLSCLILSALLFFLYFRIKKSSGLILIIYLSGYAIIRFLLEYLRLDSQPVFLALRVGQWLSILLFIMAAVLYFYRYSTNKKAAR